MGIDVTQLDDGNITNIIVRGRFDFSLQKDFRAAYNNVNSRGIKFKIDLSDTEYMDSSALGMLNLIRVYAEKLNGSVQIKNPQAGVLKLLLLVKFDQLFEIQVSQ
ncbi:MAG: STAS domain-containing protein [Ectothiorhodospiraceae bacterium]|nr:STAS domain-containing protein [Ectothiorhodospiraceae bacterium]